jgi:hypothetical protein
MCRKHLRLYQLLEVINECSKDIGYKSTCKNQLYFYFVFWLDWGLNSGLYTCKVGASLLEPHLQSILLWLFRG